MVSLIPRTWKWSLFVEEPHVITDSEVIQTPDFREVMQRLMQQVSRASFMVNGPNREVKYMVELKVPGGWQEILRGRSKVRDRPKGEFNVR